MKKVLMRGLWAVTMLHVVAAPLDAADCNSSKRTDGSCVAEMQCHTYHRECIKSATQYGYMQCPACVYEAIVLTNKKL